MTLTKKKATSTPWLLAGWLEPFWRLLFPLRYSQRVLSRVDDEDSQQAGRFAGARVLARHFVQETGITPHEFVERARIDAARMLLEGSDRPLKAVAYDCGFGTADRMRIVFNQRLGVTPAQYRASFRQSNTTRKPAGVS